MITGHFGTKDSLALHRVLDHESCKSNNKSMTGLNDYFTVGEFSYKIH